MIPADCIKALDALRAINAEWATDIDLHHEYLSSLFDQFGDEDMLLTIEDMLRHLDAYIFDNPLAFSAPDFHDVVRDVLHLVHLVDVDPPRNQLAAGNCNGHSTY